MELPTCILVDPTASVVKCREILIAEDGAALRLLMEAIQASAACPNCSQPSTRIHSHYQRQLADLPWAHVSVTIELRVRRFFCDNPACARQLFTERLPAIAAPWARRTQRLLNLQQKIGLAAGGSAGTALCHDLGCPAGVDLLLDLLRRLPLPTFPTPRVLGVDDWAKRKGQSYGTILVDHERECVVDVLADRTPETIAQWLQAHPGVKIVTRDRAEAYAQGIRAGAPEALQVADRWHLLKNLTEALTKVFQDHHRAIQEQFRQSTPPAATTTSVQTQDSAAKMAETPAITAGNKGVPAVVGTEADRRRQQRAEEAHALRQKGWQVKDIAQHLQCSRKTISRYLQRRLPLAPRQRARVTKLDAFKGYLLERWNAGGHNATQLYREIRQQGYAGQLTIVRVYVGTLRRQSGLAARSRQPGGALIRPEQIKRLPTCRMLAWLAARPTESLDEERQRAVIRLSQINPTLRTAVDLAQAFTTMVCQRRPEQLDEWLDQATHSGLNALRSFAKGLREDYSAVRAAVTVTWSNGRTEGSVNRLKCLKRQMYGRAGLDLLRRRVLTAQ